MLEKILCVDDDPNILQAYQRALRKQFNINIALGGAEALDALSNQGPYAVVVSDMQMPEMNGVELLIRVKQHSPNTVRMMLTGNADQQTALEAVNEGHIFRFITKPCPPEAFAKALNAGVTQYRLITAEKELLSKTVGGSIKVLTDVLAIVQPTAFGRASRVQRLVRQLCDEMNAPSAWQIAIAAMLSQIGCVSIPNEILEKVYSGCELTEVESETFRAHPKAGKELVANIPRLEEIAKIISYQEKHFDGSGFPADYKSGEDIPLGSRILKVALDWDILVSEGMEYEMALAEICDRKDWYDPAVVAALARVMDIAAIHIIREVTLSDLTPGMILARDIRSKNGTRLCSRGQEITTAMRLRLRNYNVNVGFDGPIKIFVPIDIAYDSAKRDLPIGGK